MSPTLEEARELYRAMGLEPKPPKTPQEVAEQAELFAAFVGGLLGTPPHWEEPREGIP